MSWALSQDYEVAPLNARKFPCSQYLREMHNHLKRALHAQPTVEALSEFDAEQAAAVRGVLGMPQKEYLDLLKAHNLYDNQLKPNNQMAKRHYMRRRVKQLIVDEVRWQYEAFCEVRASVYRTSHDGHAKSSMPCAFPESQAFARG